MGNEETNRGTGPEIERTAHQLASEALEEAAGRAREILVERLTDAIVAEAERSLAAGPARALGQIAGGLTQAAKPEQVEPVSAPEEAPRRLQQASAPPEQSCGGPDQSAGCYLFAIAQAGGPPLSPLEGMDGSGPVREVVAARLAAVVCEVPRGLFDGLDQEPVGPESRLVELARRHDEVVRAAFERRTVLPLRFGTVLTSERELLEVLQEEQSQLVAELSRLEGKAEWTCRVQPDPEAVTAVRPEPEPIGGAAYLAQREQRLAAMEEGDPHGVAAVAEQVTLAVEPHVESGRAPDLAGDETRISYLVADEAQERFAQAVVAVAEASPTVCVELLGPHPPYHFATVQLGRDGR